MGYEFDMSVAIHIDQRSIVDYPISGYSIMGILGVVFVLVQQHWGIKTAYHRGLR